jgi:hypothetical protein
MVCAILPGWLSAAPAADVAPAVLEAQRQRIDVIRQASATAVAIFAGDAQVFLGTARGDVNMAAGKFYRAEVRNGIAGTVVASNTGWSTATNAAQIPAAALVAGAFPFPAGSTDSALLLNLAPGNYTAQVNGAGGTSGVTLIETYDLENPATMQSRLVNISSRGLVGAGQNIIIPGVAINGSSARLLLVRAVGPSLSLFGVAGTLALRTRIPAHVAISA